VGTNNKRGYEGRSQFAIVTRFDEFGPTLLCNYQSSRSLLAVKSIRSVQVTDKVEGEIRYCPSSCRDDPAVLGAMIRSLTGRSRTPWTGCWT
jgi:hypothetical protein